MSLSRFLRKCNIKYKKSSGFGRIQFTRARRVNWRHVKNNFGIENSRHPERDGRSPRSFDARYFSPWCHDVHDHTVQLRIASLPRESRTLRRRGPRPCAAPAALRCTARARLLSARAISVHLFPSRSFVRRTNKNCAHARAHVHFFQKFAKFN